MGAWIEISSMAVDTIRSMVAPFMGAWIEIGYQYLFVPLRIPSLPSWERGLKLSLVRNERKQGGTSLPSWERGLKL